MKRYLLLILFIPLTVPVSSQDLKAKEYLLRMLDSIDRLVCASYNIKLHERVGDNFRDSEFNVKLFVRPFKLYAKSLYPNEGAEALLVDGFNNQKALINPNRFPFINLSLAANSSLLRKNHHYTLYDMGFSYLERVLKGYLKQDSLAFFKILRFSPNLEYAGRQYYLLEMDYPDFSYVDYKVKPDENICSIAAQLLVNDYKILSINPQLKSYDDVRPGQVIRVPNAFARKIVLYLDKTTLLPLIQTVYDDQGLFGRYEMRNFQVNPVLDKSEFTTRFPGYGF